MRTRFVVGCDPRVKRDFALLESFFEANCVYGRQVRRQRLPGIASVLADPERAGGRAECQPVAGFIHVESVPINQVVGVTLGQTRSQRLECPASVSRAVDDYAAIHRIALLILNGWNEPGRIGIVRMDSDRKAERRRFHIANLGPRRGGIC